MVYKSVDCEKMWSICLYHNNENFWVYLRLKTISKLQVHVTAVTARTIVVFPPKAIKCVGVFYPNCF